MRRVLHIALALLVLAVSCRKGPQLISRGTMEDIMYEVLLQDQFMKQHSEIKKLADTTLVYGGVFEQFGYTTDDFLYSVSAYLEDPTRMEKIMQKVESRLGKKAKELQVEVANERWRNQFLRIYNMPASRRDFPFVGQEQRDSLLYLAFRRDSLVYVPQKP